MDCQLQNVLVAKVNRPPTALTARVALLLLPSTTAVPILRYPDLILGDPEPA